MRIGIYGGTFNPIHNGHLKLAGLAYKECRLDKIFFMPSGSSYLKNHVLSSDIRYQMVCLAINGIDYFDISDMEIRREGPTYSYETFELLHRQYPEDDFFFIMGEDSLRYIEHWKEPTRLMKSCSLIVAARTDASVPEESVSDRKHILKTDADIKVDNIAELERLAHYLEGKYDTHIYCIRMHDDISSSRIRKLAAEGKDIGGMVPEAVNDFIIKNCLYKK